MKLIIIHGPPAAGKLTVANALAAKTGFRVFHNHLTIDCVRPVVEFGTNAFWRVNQRVRLVVIEEAAREGIDVIQTFVYAKGADDDNFAEFISAVEESHGEVHLVLLHCTNDERKRRIIDESRVRIGKLTDPATVDRSHLQHDLLSPFTGRENETLVIDTTHFSPDETANASLSGSDLRRSNEVLMAYESEEEIIDLVRSFESATVKREDWKHREHLIVALYYVVHYDLDDATDRMRTGIMNLLKTGFKLDLSAEMPYHETLTVFWMRTVATFNTSRNGASTVSKAAEMIQLFDKEYPLRFYSRELLFSDKARTTFAEPDLH